MTVRTTLCVKIPAQLNEADRCVHTMPYCDPQVLRVLPLNLKDGIDGRADRCAPAVPYCYPQVLRVLPLNLKEGIDGRAEPRTWLLPMLRKHVRGEVAAAHEKETC